jgi:hypothetical protein
MLVVRVLLVLGVLVVLVVITNTVAAATTEMVVMLQQMRQGMQENLAQQASGGETEQKLVHALVQGGDAIDGMSEGDKGQH